MRKLILAAFVLLMLVGGATLRAQTPDADPTGDWRGTTSAGGLNLRVAFQIGPQSTFDSPDQGVIGVPTQVAVDGQRVTVTIPRVGIYEGSLSSDGKTIDGVLKAGPTDFPIHLERGVFAALNRPQTPKPPYPYNVEQVGYDNAKEGVHLAGGFTSPAGGGRFPAVLLITGSGSQDRDETIAGHKPFLVLADALTRRGIAVLRVDDRGVGGSTAGPPGATTADLATDAEAGVAWLKQRADVDPRRIGLLGHSEGAMIASIVASRDPTIAFIVLWGGQGVDGRDVSVAQARAVALSSGASEEQARQVAVDQAAMLDVAMAAPDASSMRKALGDLAAKGKMPAGAVDASVAQLSLPWMRHFLAYDPAPTLRKVNVPVLAMLGGKDLQITPAQNEEPLRQALAGNANATVEVLPGLNHLFQNAKTGSPAEYGTIEETMAPIALNRIVNWISATVRSRSKD
jgi:hypothetical protein